MILKENARQAEKWTKMDPKERKKLYPKFHNRKYNQLRSHEKAQIKETGQEIAKKNDCNKIVVISGVGVKEYYRDHLNYKDGGPYVSKEI